MANLICVRLNKGDAPSWGFRLQGGKDFGTPLVVQKVIGGSPAERAGLIAGDTVIKINNTDVLHLRHKDAQDVILRAGNAFDVAIQRGGSTWKPNVVPVGSISAVPSAAPLSNNISPVTHTSLAASKQDSIGSIGTGHNVSAKPYHQLNGGPKLVNKQYNSPLPIYSEQSIAETLSAQTEVLANGVLGVNFKKNEKSYDAANSEVFRMVQEADKEPKDYEPEPDTSSSGVVTAPLGIAGLKHVSAPENKPAPPTPQLPPGQNICADCERLIVGVFVRIKDKNLHVECFKCATCGSSLKNVGYYNLNNKLYCDVHAKLAARSNPPAPNLQPITIPPGSKIPSGTISAALSSHSLPSPSSLSPNTNYSAAPYQPGSSYTTPKPFSSVTSPLSPIYTPISPTSTPYTGRSGVKPGAPYRESRGVQNIVWPPILNEPDIPTASPLYFPPPSQVQAHQKLLLDDTEIRTNEKGITTEEEMSFINEFAKERNMSLSSSEVYNITGRRSAIECSETISDTIDRQILVESIVQSRPKSPPSIEPKPRRTSGDVSVTFTISEAQLKQGACQNTSSDDYESKEVKVCPKGTLTHSAIANVNSKQGAYKSVSSEVSEIKELKTCLKETQSQSLASMYEKKIKVENTIPHKWESPMVTALTVASSKPYTNLSEVKEQHDTFSEIPTTTSHTPLASALVVAPAVPFTPACTSTLEPVPLPDETVPYFPPEHPIISQPKDTDGEKKEKKIAKKVYGKKKEEVDLLFQDLPTPPVEKISMLAALTTAPDRPYSPFNPDSATPTTTSHEEVTSKAETNINTEIQKTKAVVATKTLEDYSFISHTSKPILKTYVPFPTYQVNEVSNTCTTVDEENQIREETSTSVNKHASEKSEVSKNVQSSENITNVCAGLPPMIQVVRSTFETSTDKVQMEMSCQYLGDSVPQRQIIERHTTTDVSQQKAVEHRDTEEHKTSSEIIHNKNKEHQKSTHATSQQKAIEKRALTQHKEQQKQFQNIVDMPSKSALAAVVSSQVTESVLLQKATSNIESERHSVTTEQFRTSKKAHKEPLTVLKPGESSLSVPQISFQPVIEDACSSTTFSSRPGSLTPSMINKPAPVLPYYQASLVATECTPVGTNLFDPTSPAISRSPSPCIVRPPSPFATPSAALRPVSPAQGPPPNPLQSHKSVYEIKREGKVQDALAHIQTFIPQHQSKAYHARTESYKEEPPKEWKVLSTNDDKSITVRESAKEADLFEASKLENTSVQCKRDGNLQIQRKTHTTEEYEHQQKSKMIQIETLSSSTKKLEEKKATASLTGGQVAVGFHVTNPQPLKSPFRGADGASIPETQSKIPKRVQQTDSGTKTNCPTVNSSASASVAPAKICPNKNVTKPSISQPNLGTGGGRQAGAIGVAPKRGRGVLNLAATPGSRVPLCAQCNANIRGPFITALGKIWCPDHFICATPSCRRPLHDLGFVEEHGQLYCEYCFEQYLAPPCSKCNTKIKGDCLKAIGRNFHPECFNCVYCGKLFGNSPFFLEDAQPYCETDWNELFTTKCFACGFPVEAGDRWVEALSNNYHSQCFNCTMCKKNLEGQSFFAKGGRPFCKNHAR